jgi:outer membrane scaffolding protein for murein synthesis (MipA/OmpV family)
MHFRPAERRARRTLLAAAAPAAALALSAPAFSQTPSPLQEWQYSGGIVLETMFEPKVPDWRAILGLGSSLQPLYDGARPYHIEVGPAIDLRYRDWAFLSTGEGLGVNILRGSNYRAGVALAYDLGRRVAQYPSHLTGLTNIEPAPVAKLFASYAISKQFPAVLRVDIRRVLGGADGVIGDIGAYMPLPGSSRKLVMFAGPSVTLADATYMRNVFGVGEAQSARSGYPQFNAHAGLKSAGFGLSATWFFADHWLLDAEAAFSRLLGSAARSPITQSPTEGALDLTIAYKF